MDFSWINAFLVFLLFCLLFMAIMMIGCRGMHFRCGHAPWSGRSSRDGPPDR
jgi:hypothetical protein